MITRAYQNSNGERQEITLSAEHWEAMSEADLDNVLGFGKKAAKTVKAEEAPAVEAAPVAEEAPAAEEAPVAEEAPAKKGK